MAATPIYRVLAQAFIAEGVRVVFVLTGDGNMHWEAAMAESPEVRSVHVRHEHCACAMATAYARATGLIGVASVTCGPGLTQIMTALATATQAQIPLVVFSGESPMHANWYNQHIEQGPLVRATGAAYVSAHSPQRMLNQVRDVFHLAHTERRPVVLGVPLDLQQQLLPNVPEYLPSTRFVPDVGRMPPDPAYVRRAAERIMAAERIVLLGGLGVMQSDARADCLELADRCGALLASTLPVRGLFDDHPQSLGVAGGFSHEVARTRFADADLVIAVGASMSHHTMDGGQLFPRASVIQIDPEPRGLWQGHRVADLYLRADAREGVRALIGALGPAPTSAPGWRSDRLAAETNGPADTASFPPDPDGLDPREVIRALDDAIPKDWEVVNASGHCSYYSAQMRGRSADRFLAIREFGAIGNGLSYAIGLAVARPERPVLLIDGDGGFLMHVQELETVRRYGLKILICILNDGAYGSEVHKLRADGLDEHGAIFGRGDLGQLARGFGLRGAIVRDLDELPSRLSAHHEADISEVWDFPISDQVISPPMRRQNAKRSGERRKASS